MGGSLGSTSTIAMALVQSVVVALPFFLVFSNVDVGAVTLTVQCLDPKPGKDHGPPRFILIDTDGIINAPQPADVGPINVQRRTEALKKTDVSKPKKRIRLPLHIPDSPEGERQPGETYRILIPPNAVTTFLGTTGDVPWRNQLEECSSTTIHPQPVKSPWEAFGANAI